MVRQTGHATRRQSKVVEPKNSSLGHKLKTTRAHVKSKVSTRSNKKIKTLRIGEFSTKQSKWGTKASNPSQYEKWKQAKQDKKRRHIRKHSEQLFKTLRENSQFRGPSDIKSKRKETLKNKKKLSIEINKNGFEYSQNQHFG